MFQLPDALLQDTDKSKFRVLFSRHCYQVFEPIVGLDAVKMMHDIPEIDLRRT